MVNNLMSFLGGVGDFASYISSYFKEKGIRDIQKQIDDLTRSLENCTHSKEVAIKKCEQDKELIKLKYSQEIDELVSDINAAKPKIGGRVIEG